MFGWVRRARIPKDLLRDMPDVHYFDVTRREGEIVLRLVREDPSDDTFLACAVSGQASHLISGDRHLLVLGVHQNIRILTPAEFLTGFPKIG